jgi:hypothetical protein
MKNKGGHVEASDDKKMRYYESIYKSLTGSLNDIITLIPSMIYTIGKIITIFETKITSLQDQQRLNNDLESSTKQKIDKDIKSFSLLIKFYKTKIDNYESEIQNYLSDLEDLKANFWNDLYIHSTDKVGEEIEKLNENNSKFEKAKKTLNYFKTRFEKIYGEFLKDYELLSPRNDLDIENDLIIEIANFRHEITELINKIENNKQLEGDLNEIKKNNRLREITPYKRDFCYNYPCSSEHLKHISVIIDPLYGTLKYIGLDIVEIPIKKIDKYTFLYADGKLLSTYGQVYGLNYKKHLALPSDKKKYPTFKWAAVNPNYNSNGWNEKIANKIFYGEKNNTYFLFPDNTKSGKKIEVLIKSEKGRRYFESVRHELPLYKLGIFYDNSYLEKNEKIISFIQKEEYNIYKKAYEDYNKAFNSKVFLDEVNIFSEFYTYIINGGRINKKDISDKVGHKNLKKTKRSIKKQRKTRKNK